MFGFGNAAMRVGEMTELTDQAIEAGRNLLFGESQTLPSGLTVTMTQFGPQVSRSFARGTGPMASDVRPATQAHTAKADQEVIDVRRRAIAGRGAGAVGNRSRRSAGERMLTALRR